jgi:hypothetical protein
MLQQKHQQTGCFGKGTIKNASPARLLSEWLKQGV